MERLIKPQKLAETSDGRLAIAYLRLAQVIPSPTLKDEYLDYVSYYMVSAYLNEN